jgi:hypothetical protein
MSLLTGLVLAFVAYAALSHPGGRHSAASLFQPLATPPAVAGGTANAAGAQPSQSSAAPVTGRGPANGTAALPLVVLDNTGRSELARAAADQFKQAGWTVTDTSTFDGNILSTAAYYDPATPGARAAAEALQVQFSAIRRVRPKFDGLPPGPIVVVLALDYSSGQTTS